MYWLVQKSALSNRNTIIFMLILNDCLEDEQIVIDCINMENKLNASAVPFSQ
jgi:hypothetical protein